MKKSLKQFLPALFLFAVLCAPLRAQTSPAKIATIDLQKVCDKYYKWQRANDVLAKEDADLKSSLTDMDANIKKEQTEYTKLRGTIDDPMVTPETRKKRSDLAETKLKEIESDQQSIRDLANQGQTRLSVEAQRLTESLMQDIQTQVKERARAGGYSLVLNSSSDALRPGSTVLYSNGENDLTDEIIKQLNAAVPASLAPADATKPATNAPDKKK